VIGAVTLVTVNAAINPLIAVNAAAARIRDGRATTVISDRQIAEKALRRLGLRRSEIDHAVRLQNGDDITEAGCGSLEPGGQRVLTPETIRAGCHQGRRRRTHRPAPPNRDPAQHPR
jgi:uncharacterized membrane protein YcaP (DUF421 family)